MTPQEQDTQHEDLVNGLVWQAIDDVLSAEAAVSTKSTAIKSISRVSSILPPKSQTTFREQKTLSVRTKIALSSMPETVSQKQTAKKESQP